MLKKESGLNSLEVIDRLKKYGYNEIKDTSKTSPLKILLRQIKSNFVIYLLFIAMIISFIVNKNITAYTLIIVIILVIGTGFLQEFKAENAIKSLRQMITPVSIIIRDGKEQEAESKNLVPGDIILLRIGEKIPADCLILEEKELLLNESILTGESKEVKKYSTKKHEYKDENLVFMGSFILNGRCTAKVIHTGMNTKFGKIANLISTTEKELPLQDRINKITKYMVIVAISISILTGFLLLFKTPIITTETIVEILILVIAISVSAFPEGLPVVLITTLSVGAYNMAKKNAIVNRMSIIETLGETTVICADKTGTITKGEMTVKEIFTNDNIYNVSGVGYEANGEFYLNNEKINVNSDKNIKDIIKISLLCNDSIIQRLGEDNNYKVIGTPTEGALLILAAKAKYFKEDIDIIRKEEIPFSSERKIMSVVCKEKNILNVYTKGALEILLKKCKYIQKNNKIIKITKNEIENILKINKEMASKSLRTLAFGYKKYKNEKDIEKDLIFVGIAGMEDPPREEMIESLIHCKNSGIKVKMITGDNKDTAIAIAKEIGLPTQNVISGLDIDKITDEELSKIVNDITIFTRVKPEHKLRIVRALKQNGEIVTMTGDGVNDAPALKEAQIGVAMGKNGTDVSRSVADLILKDDKFSTIIEAIKEGRGIFKNIKKFVSYQLSCNCAELMILFFGVLLSSFFSWPIPMLLALQILFMNIVTDNLPALTLGFNPQSKDIINEKPRIKAEIINKRIFGLILFTGTIMSLLAISTFYIVFNILKENEHTSRTTTLLTLILLEIGAAFVYRSFSKNVLTRSPLSNKYLVIASFISIIATIIIIYTPLNKVFTTVSLNMNNWVIAIIMVFVLIIIFDLLKTINAKNKFWSEN